MDTETTQPSLEAEYQTLHAELLAVHQPRDAHERLLVEEFVDACWDWKAARRVDREFWIYAGSHHGGGHSGVAEAQFKEKEARFRTHLRYRADCERSYYRALGALKNLSRDTRRPSLAAQPAPAADSFTNPASPLIPADRLGMPDNVNQSLQILRHSWLAVLAWIALHMQPSAPVPATAGRRSSLATLLVADRQNVPVRQFPHWDPRVRVLPFRRLPSGPRASPSQASRLLAA